jgi:FkbM family methyltransferase
VIVIDVGCARWGNDYSIERLIQWYHPDVLIGFDPAKDVAKAMPRADVLATAKTQVILRREAAWVYDGEVRFMEDGLNSQVGDAEHWPLVRCVDLARVIEELPEGPVVLKLDAEGAEYDLLEHLIATGAAARLTRLLVEWHPTGQGERRRAIETGLRIADVPVEQWRW